MSLDHTGIGRTAPSIQRAPMGEVVATHLRSLIVARRIPAGDFLRPDRIADELDISVTPVREALVTLRSEGLVRLEPNRGFVVAEFSAEDVRDTFLIRAKVGAELAARAATRITPERLGVLVRHHERWEQELVARDFLAADEDGRDFQRIVHDIADAPKLRWFYEVLMRSSTYSSLVMEQVPVEDGRDSNGSSAAAAQHDAPSLLHALLEVTRRHETGLLEAFAAGDEAAAAAVARAYDEQVGELVASSFAEQAPSAEAHRARSRRRNDRGR